MPVVVRGQVLTHSKRADGAEMNLEIMFRGGVFTGIAGRDINQVLHMGAVADRKAIPPSLIPPGAGNR